MTVLAVWGLAIAIVTGGRFMVPERHALPRDNNRHALERHDERDDDGKQANEPQTHGGIVLHAIGRATARRVPPDAAALVRVMRMHYRMPLAPRNQPAVHRERGDRRDAKREREAAPEEHG
jgi:hypothetical protein